MKTIRLTCVLITLFSVTACDLADQDGETSLDDPIAVMGTDDRGPAPAIVKGVRDLEYEGAPPEEGPVRDVSFFMDDQGEIIVLGLIANPFDETVEVRYYHSNTFSMRRHALFPSVARIMNDIYFIDVRKVPSSTTVWIRIEWINSFYQYFEIHLGPG